MIKQDDSSVRQKNGWMLSSRNFTAKCGMDFFLTQENKTPRGFILKPIERPYVFLKSSTLTFLKQSSV